MDALVVLALKQCWKMLLFSSSDEIEDDGDNVEYTVVSFN